MSIAPVGMPALPSLPLPVTPLDRAPGAPTTTGTQLAGGFGEMLADRLSALQALHTDTDVKARAAATGDLTDVHDYTIASARSGVATEMTVAFRNKAVEAFTEIMRMHI